MLGVLGGVGGVVAGAGGVAVRLCRRGPGRLNAVHGLFAGRPAKQLQSARPMPKAKAVMAKQAGEPSSSIPTPAKTQPKRTRARANKEEPTALLATVALDRVSQDVGAVERATEGVSPTNAVRSPVKRRRVLTGGPTREMEAELWAQGYSHVAGIDEAGRGPLAGPVVAAACVLDPSVAIEGINDSKKMTEADRERLHDTLASTSGVYYAVSIVDAQKIDDINILQATMTAMQEAVHKLRDSLGKEPDYVLVDGNRVPSGISASRSAAVIKGDSKCLAIAAASIFAKVTRDRIMREYDRKWPNYGFGLHKGYPTAAHVASLKVFGPVEIHRRTFTPIKEMFPLPKKKGLTKWFKPTNAVK
eukprot:jgi/Chlat1/249/Chrsp1S03152